ncbi:hypothetical protein GYB22_10510 [bacterium]|nr:hypothetical protein [bacterium]
MRFGMVLVLIGCYILVVAQGNDSIYIKRKCNSDLNLTAYDEPCSNPEYFPCSFGLYSANQGWIISPIFNDIRAEQGYFIVSLCYKHGLVDSAGNFIVNPYWESITLHDIGDSVAIVCRDRGRSRLFYAKGRRIQKGTYNSITGTPIEGLFLASRYYDQRVRGKGDDTTAYIERIREAGLINIQGDTVFPFIGEALQVVTWDSMYFVWVKNAQGYWKLFDVNANLLTPEGYQFESYSGGDFHFVGGLVRVKHGKKYGILSYEGELKLNLEFDYLSFPFKNGLVYFEKGDINGYIDTNFVVYQGMKSEHVMTSLVRDPFPYPEFDSMYWSDYKLRKVKMSELFLQYLTVPMRKEFLDYDHGAIDQQCYWLFLRKHRMVGSHNRDSLKQHVFKILKYKKRVEGAWFWAKPMIKQAFGMMNSVVRKSMLRLLINLRDYVNAFNQKKVEAHLANNEAQFAFETWEKEVKRSREERMLHAQFDRLIVYHKVMNYKDAKYWVNRIVDEIASWSE